jgi:hypothetical protein
MKVSLIQLLKDWRDRKKHPLVSFISVQHPSKQGEIWIEDFDVGQIYDSHVTLGTGTHQVSFININAADPEFFDKLDAALKQLEDQLKNMVDG